MFPRFPQPNLEAAPPQLSTFSPKHHSADIGAQLHLSPPEKSSYSWGADISENSCQYGSYENAKLSPTYVVVSGVSTAATTPETIKGSQNSKGREGPVIVSYQKKESSTNSLMNACINGNESPKSENDSHTTERSVVPISNRVAHPIPKRLRWFVKLVGWIQQGPDADFTAVELTPTVSRTANCDWSPAHSENLSSASRSDTSHALIRRDDRRLWENDGSSDEEGGIPRDVGFHTFHLFEKTESPKLVKRNSWCTPGMSERRKMSRVMKRASRKEDRHVMSADTNFELLSEVLCDPRWEADDVARIGHIMYRMEFWFAVISVLMHCTALILAASTTSSPNSLTVAVHQPQIGNGVITAGWLLVLFCLALIRAILSKRILLRVAELHSLSVFFNSDIRVGIVEVYKSVIVNLFRFNSLIKLGWLICGFFVLYGKPISLSTSSYARMPSLLQSTAQILSQHLNLQILYQYCIAVLLLNVALFGAHLMRFFVSVIGLIASFLATSEVAVVALASTIMKMTSPSPHKISVDAPSSQEFNIPSEFKHLRSKPNQHEDALVQMSVLGTPTSLIRTEEDA